METAVHPRLGGTALLSIFLQNIKSQPQINPPGTPMPKSRWTEPTHVQPLSAHHSKQPGKLLPAENPEISHPTSPLVRNAG